MPEDIGGNRLDSLVGSCHCGTVRFRIDWPIVELTTCDCTLCVKRNAVMTKVPEAALTILEGEDVLTLYQWNTRRAKHYFCSCCGIYVFHRKRAAPDHFGVNIFCLEGVDPSAFPIRATDGIGMSIESPPSRTAS
ncbi:MAG: GFA family protein [Pseudomonadota bacterium]|nr:GFA family protein [Pseudomonadota bacterium]